MNSIHTCNMERKIYVAPSFMFHFPRANHHISPSLSPSQDSSQGVKFLIFSFFAKWTIKWHLLAVHFLMVHLQKAKSTVTICATVKRICCCYGDSFCKQGILFQSSCFLLRVPIWILCSCLCQWIKFTVDCSFVTQRNSSFKRERWRGKANRWYLGINGGGRGQLH